MTTRLAGEKTRFLPFNRGSHPVRCGAAPATRSMSRVTEPPTSGSRCLNVDGS